MNVEYRDGRTEFFNHQTPEEIVAMTERLTNDDGDVQAIKVRRTDKTPAQEYLGNRAERRKWLHDKRRESKKGA
jgi:hypothetical protein